MRYFFFIPLIIVVLLAFVPTKEADYHYDVTCSINGEISYEAQQMPWAMLNGVTIHIQTPADENIMYHLNPGEECVVKSYIVQE